MTTKNNYTTTTYNNNHNYNNNSKFIYILANVATGTTITSITNIITKRATYINYNYNNNYKKTTNITTRTTITSRTNVIQQQLHLHTTILTTSTIAITTRITTYNYS